MKRVIATATVAALGCALVGTAAPAGAAGSSTAYAGPAYAVGGTISPTASVSGSLGNLLGPILNPVLAGLVNPLLSGVASLPQSLVSGLTTSLVGQSYANSPAPGAPDEGSSFPACTTSPWSKTTQSCYQAGNLVVAAPPVVAASLSAADGYTSAISSASAPTVAAASEAVTALALLGVPIINGGTLSSKSSCPTSGSSSPTATATGVNLSLLGGAVTATTAGNGSLANVSVKGSPLVGVSSITASGLPVSVSLNGNLLKLAITLNVSQLVSGLGLSVAGSLLSDVTSSSLTLTVTVGPGSTTSASGSASAWGLEVGVDLAGSIGISVLGLANVALTIPSGLTNSGGGNALDLKLGYTNCTATPGSTGTTAVPPGVN